MAYNHDEGCCLSPNEICGNSQLSDLDSCDILECLDWFQWLVLDGFLEVKVDYGIPKCNTNELSIYCS